MTIETTATNQVERLRSALDRFPALTRKISPDVPRGVVVGSGARARTRRVFLEALTGTPILERPRRAPKKDVLGVLVDRVTLGPTAEELQLAESLGYDGYLEHHLDHLSIDDSAAEARLAAFPTIDMSPKELVDGYAGDPFVPYVELKDAQLIRQVFSKRQLFERMAEFWRDHFNINHAKDVEYFLLPEDDKVVIRQHALGLFPDMLRASGHSGAMLYYLDNWLNVAGNVQENYSRESMELHSTGIGPYTEADVVEVAKCYTGWSLELDFDSPDYLRGAFLQSSHQGGDKTVMGTLIPELPHRQQLNAVMNLLSGHASTARFVSGKLIRWMLTENPPDELVDSIAAVYTNTGGDIKELLRAILSRDNVKAYAEPKLKRPTHLIVSMLRAIGADVTDPLNLLGYQQFMGQLWGDNVTPDGYPDEALYWGSSVLSRWTFLVNLMSELISGVNIHKLTLFAELDPSQVQGIARRINRRYLGRALSDDDEQIVQQYASSVAPLSGDDVLEVIALAASAPGFQWY